MTGVHVDRVCSLLAEITATAGGRGCLREGGISLRLREGEVVGSRRKSKRGWVCGEDWGGRHEEELLRLW